VENKENNLELEKTEADSKVKPITSTGKGDRGQTRLFSGEKVSKSHLRIEVCGNLDETSAAMGLGKAFTVNGTIRNIISTIQDELILLGAEVSSTERNLNVKLIGQEHISQLEEWIKDLQMEVPLPRCFIQPGANPVAAALDMARTVARRTERSLVVLQEAGQIHRAEVLKYLNRLGFLLYTLARYAEKKID
jgi:cob(I)alamin adenosyltransferase